MQKKALSYIARKALAKGIIVGSITITIYLLVVVLTTPNLSPISAMIATFKANSIIVIGLGIGIGSQVFISSYSKGLGCGINKRKSILGSGSGSAALGSFFSFFSLVPLGCCGSWLLILSMLPSILGSTASVVLIEYSKTLSYLSLAIVFGFASLSAYKLHKRMKGRGKVVEDSHSSINKQY